MDPRQLEVFLGVIEHGRVTHAPEKLYLSAGAVSVQLMGKHYMGGDSGFVFRNCTLTAEPGVKNVWLGRQQGWRQWNPEANP